MNGPSPREPKPQRSSRMRTARLAAAAIVVLAATAPACLSRPIEPLDPRTTSTVSERTTSDAVDKIDLLLAIDNSASMEDKQQILKAAVPDLVNRLVNPLCLTPEGTQAATPSDPNADCPAGSDREFKAITDIHIGIVSSSLGDGGANTFTAGGFCPDMNSVACPNNSSLNDKGHLITRMDPCGSAEAPTYQSLGFLAWDPTQKLTPPGEGNAEALVASVSDLVVGTGQVGCGFEAQNESWYRFLVDPEPYLSIADGGGRAVLTGTDEDLLKQRRDFLRPNSLVAIVMLTDENDCSGIAGGTNVLPFLQTRMSKASAKCAEDPNDACCAPCNKYPDTCPADATCTGAATYAAEDDDWNLRCFNQKQRFGRDFLYEPQRYITGLTSDQVPGRDGKPKPNPLFSDLNPDDDNSAIRGSGLVFLAGVVGVPWQDIQRTEDGKGNPIPADELQFKTVSQMNADGTWDKILGDPANYVPPTDPHMIESVGPRAGLPDQTTPDDALDPIHGHEWDTRHSDLQFACIFDLPTPRVCDSSTSCTDCEGNSPLCTTNPTDSTKRNWQVRAKAYPGTRHLSILRGLGDQGIVASVCPKQLTDTARGDYGYRPAVSAIIDRLKTKLGGQCLPRALTVNPDTKQIDACIIIEASKSAGGACDCNVAGRIPVPDENKEAITAAKADPSYETAQWDCFCAIPQLSDDGQLTLCQNEVSDESQTGDGWCYVDPSAGAGDNEELVSNCPDASQRKIRFVGAGNSSGGNVTFITCSGD